ncbi:hypothetical protein AYO45_02460 [Gammaproteobacteria bacterium SCGC AG-212-F23]|nr:hypothetical protein AYO45_02460 [Gammaproteobacteria bacterium SCGC AG-212-F23]
MKSDAKIISQDDFDKLISSGTREAVKQALSSLTSEQKKQLLNHTSRVSREAAINVAIKRAIKSNDTSITEELLEHKEVDVNTRMHNGLTPLMQCLQTREAANATAIIVVKLIANPTTKFDLTEPDSHFSALTFAILHCPEAACAMLDDSVQWYNIIDSHVDYKGESIYHLLLALKFSGSSRLILALLFSNNSYIHPEVMKFFNDGKDKDLPKNIQQLMDPFVEFTKKNIQRHALLVSACTEQEMMYKALQKWNKIRESDYHWWLSSALLAEGKYYFTRNQFSKAIDTLQRAIYLGKSKEISHLNEVIDILTSITTKKPEDKKSQIASTVSTNTNPSTQEIIAAHLAIAEISTWFVKKSTDLIAKHLAVVRNTYGNAVTECKAESELLKAFDYADGIYQPGQFDIHSHPGINIAKALYNAAVCQSVSAYYSLMLWANGFPRVSTIDTIAAKYYIKKIHKQNPNMALWSPRKLSMEDEEKSELDKLVTTVIIATDTVAVQSDYIDTANRFFTLAGLESYNTLKYIMYDCAAICWMKSTPLSMSTIELALNAYKFAYKFRTYISTKLFCYKFSDIGNKIVDQFPASFSIYIKVLIYCCECRETFGQNEIEILRYGIWHNKKILDAVIQSPDCFKPFIEVIKKLFEKNAEAIHSLVKDIFKYAVEYALREKKYDLLLNILTQLHMIDDKAFVTEKSMVMELMDKDENYQKFTKKTNNKIAQEEKTQKEEQSEKILTETQDAEFQKNYGQKINNTSFQNLYEMIRTETPDKHSIKRAIEKSLEIFTQRLLGPVETRVTTKEFEKESSLQNLQLIMKIVVKNGKTSEYVLAHRVTQTLEEKFDKQKCETEAEAVARFRFYQVKTLNFLENNVDAKELADTARKSLDNLAICFDEIIVAPVEKTMTLGDKTLTLNADPIVSEKFQVQHFCSKLIEQKNMDPDIHRIAQAFIARIEFHNAENEGGIRFLKTMRPLAVKTCPDALFALAKHCFTEFLRKEISFSFYLVLIVTLRQPFTEKFLSKKCIDKMLAEANERLTTTDMKFSHPKLKSVINKMVNTAYTDLITDIKRKFNIIPADEENSFALVSYAFRIYSSDFNDDCLQNAFHEDLNTGLNKQIPFPIMQLSDAKSAATVVTTATTATTTMAAVSTSSSATIQRSLPPTAITVATLSDDRKSAIRHMIMAASHLVRAQRFLIQPGVNNPATTIEQSQQSRNNTP